ncbi:hypothetical protein PHJA_000638100 [Phtheirospermum japonicum]|uniref:Uncharacterized protein n=1 Tax=Phtheirospermum japonicum TaxID=374723 RepID=A0A830BL68_9LAMI|nr:hypothetical protein PHJA_000638100 [Phtheirospermum japonicum]
MGSAVETLCGQDFGTGQLDTGRLSAEILDPPPRHQTPINVSLYFCITILITNRTD